MTRDRVIVGGTTWSVGKVRALVGGRPRPKDRGLGMTKTRVKVAVRV